MFLTATLATVLGGCADSRSGAETTATGDIPEHTVERIVELVRNNLLAAQTSDDERTAAGHLESGGDHHWVSQYADPRTWTVELIIPGEDGSRAVYRWLVLDFNARISFLGVFRGSVVEPSR